VVLIYFCRKTYGFGHFYVKLENFMGFWKAKIAFSIYFFRNGMCFLKLDNFWRQI